jgi:hypothetical protein
MLSSGACISRVLTLRQPLKPNTYAELKPSAAASDKKGPEEGLVSIVEHPISSKPKGTILDG